MSPVNTNLSLLVVAALLLLAGCAGTSGSHPNNATTTTTSKPISSTSTTTPDTSTANRTARERAIAAEERRVARVLDDASNVTGTVPGYAEPEATVLDTTERGVRVRVVMPYSYEYSCGDRAGAVDNVKTRTSYLVTNESTRLLEIHQGVKLLCPPE